MDKGSATEHECEHDGLGGVSLVPPRRLGAVLADHREGRGWTRELVAGRSGGLMTAADLGGLERGERLLDDASLRDVIDLYEIDTGSLVPERARLVIDLDGGLLHIDERIARIGRRSGRPEVLLPRYLSLVYSLRGVPPGRPIPLRADDLDVLGRALRVGIDSVAADLTSLMSDSDGEILRRSRLLSRRVLVPAAGILVALCGVGSILLLADGANPAAADPSASSSVVRQSTPPSETNGETEASSLVGVGSGAEIGTAVVQERLADGSPGPVVERSSE